MPSGHAKQEGVGLSSQMEPKAFEGEVVTGRDLKAGEGSDGEDLMMSLQMEGNQRTKVHLLNSCWKPEPWTRPCMYHFL